MLAVVGLGNPGTAYKNSRHNTGFMLVDGIADGYYLRDVIFHQHDRSVVRRFFGLRTKFRKTSTLYLDVEGEVDWKRFLLVKPTTFMNESGRAIAKLLNRGKVRDISEVLVVVDDVDLETGSIRLRTSGSAGGHKGLKSIINHLGTGEFSRLRIGIGPRPNGSDLIEYVLGTFRPEEREILERSLIKASNVVKAWITKGLEEAYKELQ